MTTGRINRVTIFGPNSRAGAAEWVRSRKSELATHWMLKEHPLGAVPRGLSPARGASERSNCPQGLSPDMVRLRDVRGPRGRSGELRHTRPKGGIPAASRHVHGTDTGCG